MKLCAIDDVYRKLGNLNSQVSSGVLPCRHGIKLILVATSENQLFSMASVKLEKGMGKIVQHLQSIA